MTDIINKTPHAIALTGSDGVTRVIDKTGQPVRIETEASDQVDAICKVPVYRAPRVTGISNLPPRRPGVTIVVSQIAALGIAALHPDRDDVVYPGTGPGDAARRVKRSVISASRLIRAV